MTTIGKIFGATFGGIMARYLGFHYIIGLLIMSVVLGSVAAMFDLFELFRRAAGKENVTADVVFQMAAFKFPSLLDQLAPLIVLFGALYAFWRLSRARELIAARSVGVSIWQILSWPIAISVGLGGIAVVLLNPLVAHLQSQYEDLENMHLNYRQSRLALSPTGLWLRERIEDNFYVLNAKKVTQNTITDQNNLDNQFESNLQLEQITVFQFNAQDRFIARFDGPKASLNPGLWPGVWKFDQVLISKPGEAGQQLDDFSLETTMTLQSINEHFQSADSLSVWQLQTFMQRMGEAGFSIIPYQLHWHSLLARPFLFGSMVLIAAIFAMRSSRTVRMMHVMGGGVLVGFALYLLTYITQAIGLNGTIPVVLAGWLPTIVSLGLSSSLLLHLEDG